MQYISKDALVAEINRIKKEDYYDIHDEYDGFVRNALDKVLSIIDTLEVKEVDLEKEIEENYREDTSTLKSKKEYAKIAKHFFELGLKA